jgi:hypothetical protein
LNLRAQAEADLAVTLEGDFGLPVVLVNPNDGSKQELTGQVLYSTTRQDPDTGVEVVVFDPVVTLRRSSITTLPAPNEVWVVQIPETPDPNADLKSFALQKAPEGGKDLGHIRLYLTEIRQS